MRLLRILIAVVGSVLLVGCASTVQTPAVQVAIATDTPLPTDTATAMPTVAPVLPTAVPTNIPTDTEVPTSAPVLVDVVKSATLHAGPGETFAIAESVEPGEFLMLVAQDKTKSWYQLDGGQWIAASAISEHSANLPIVEPTPSPTRTPPPTATPRPPTATAVPSDTPVPPTPTPVPPTDTPVPTETPIANWFTGGTLHQSTWAEWQAATDANKLATAADWITNIYKPEWQTMEELRILSEELVACMDETELTAIELYGEDGSTSDIVVACVIIMMDQ